MYCLLSYMIKKNSCKKNNKGIISRRRRRNWFIVGGFRMCKKMFLFLSCVICSRVCVLSFLWNFLMNMYSSVKFQEYMTHLCHKYFQC